MAPSSQPAAQSIQIKSADLASRIDHTLLKADATHEDVRRLCEEARAHGFASVCVNSSFVAWAAELLRGARTYPIAVVGFPLGAASSEACLLYTSDAADE